MQWRYQIVVEHQRREDLAVVRRFILLGLAGLVLRGGLAFVYSACDGASYDAARTEVVQIQHAVELYRLYRLHGSDHRCPRNLQEMRDAGVFAKVGKDPWGKDYVILCRGSKLSADVLSAGPDGDLYTEDDVTLAAGR